MLGEAGKEVCLLADALLNYFDVVFKRFLAKITPDDDPVVVERTIGDPRIAEYMTQPCDEDAVRFYEQHTSLLQLKIKKKGKDPKAESECGKASSDLSAVPSARGGDGGTLSTAQAKTGKQAVKAKAQKPSSKSTPVGSGPPQVTDTVAGVEQGEVLGHDSFVFDESLFESADPMALPVEKSSGSSVSRPTGLGKGKGKGKERPAVKGNKASKPKKATASDHDQVTDEIEAAPLPSSDFLQIGVGNYSLSEWEEACEKILKKVKEHEFVRIRPLGENNGRHTAIANFFSPVIELYPTIAEEYLKMVK